MSESTKRQPDRVVYITCCGFNTDPIDNRNNSPAEGGPGGIATALLDSSSPLCLDEAANKVIILWNKQSRGGDSYIVRTNAEGTRVEIKKRHPELIVELREINQVESGGESESLELQMRDIVLTESSESFFTSFRILLNGMPNQSLGLVSALQALGQRERFSFYTYGTSFPFKADTLFELNFGKRGAAIKATAQLDDLEAGSLLPAYRDLSEALSYTSEHSEWADFLQTALVCASEGYPIALHSERRSREDHKLWAWWIYDQVINRRGAWLEGFANVQDARSFVGRLEDTETRAIFYPIAQPNEEDIHKVNKDLERLIKESRPPRKVVILSGSTADLSGVSSAHPLSPPLIDSPHLLSLCWRACIRAQIKRIIDLEQSRLLANFTRWLSYYALSASQNIETLESVLEREMSKRGGLSLIELYTLSASFIDRVLSWLQSNTEEWRELLTPKQGNKLDTHWEKLKKELPKLNEAGVELIKAVTARGGDHD